MSFLTRRTTVLTGALALGSACAFPAVISGTAFADGGSSPFISSAHENADFTVTFPLHEGTSNGQKVYYLITAASDASLAQRIGVDTAQKLANARDSAAVQKVTVNSDGSFNFPATVNFNAQPRKVVPGPGGFPAVVVQPNAVGEPGYSPLIQLPDGTIEDAPQIANSTGQADLVVSLDLAHNTVTYRETHGFQGGRSLHFITTDASEDTPAAVEGVTLAPALEAAPGFNDDGSDSSRASAAAFTNGQTGVSNPQRQGISSAILDGLDNLLPVIAWNPNQGLYSPVLDVHLTQWSQAAVAAQQNTRQTDYNHVEKLADQGVVTSFNGTAAGASFAASGVVVNYSVVAFGS